MLEVAVDVRRSERLDATRTCSTSLTNLTNVDEITTADSVLQQIVKVIGVAASCSLKALTALDCCFMFACFMLCVHIKCVM